MATMIFLLLALLSLFAHAQDIPGYKLVWRDEFDGPNLDRSKWKHDVNCWGGGNGEHQCYVDNAQTLYIANGQLHLKANYVPNGHTGSAQGCTLEHTREACTWTKKVTSARISTKGLHFWKYGRFEARMRIPAGMYLWPAFWMLPERSEYGTWAASGEIDIMEAKGHKSWEVHHTLHYGGVSPFNDWTKEGVYNHKWLMSDDFHTFAVDWKENEMRFYIDGVQTYYVNLLSKVWWNDWPGNARNPYTRPGQPWDKDFYLVLNLAVGGNYFGPEEAAKVNPAQDAASWNPFIIDYVRVYKPSGGLPTPPPKPVTPPSTSGGSSSTQCTFDKDIDFFGNDVGSKPAATKEECCGWCRSVPNCHAWTYAYGTCWGKSAPGNSRKFVAGHWSGTVAGARAIEEGSENTMDSTTTSSAKMTETVAIAIGCVLGGLALVVLVVALLFVRRVNSLSPREERA